MRNPELSVLSMGEGRTPLIRLRNLEKVLRFNGRLWAKAEYQNPTGSFKDRGSLFEVAEALRQGKKGVVCASTGNMAASLSAYARRALLTCQVVIPAQTPQNKVRQAAICGAEVIRVDGDYDACVQDAKKIAEEKDFLLCGDYETRRIGQRTVGIELSTPGVVFDAFICPVGNGTIACAVAEGFAYRNQYPRFIGVRGVGLKTAGSAMDVKTPLDGKLTRSWIKKTKGSMIDVTEKELKVAQRLLASTEGIYIETSSAATVAGLQKLTDQSFLKNVVLILTGSGMKEGGGLNG